MNNITKVFGEDKDKIIEESIDYAFERIADMLIAGIEEEGIRTIYKGPFDFDSEQSKGYVLGLKKALKISKHILTSKKNDFKDSVIEEVKYYF